MEGIYNRKKRVAVWYSIKDSNEVTVARLVHNKPKDVKIITYQNQLEFIEQQVRLLKKNHFNKLESISSDVWEKICKLSKLSDRNGRLMVIGAPFIIANYYLCNMKIIKTNLVNKSELYDVNAVFKVIGYNRKRDRIQAEHVEYGGDKSIIEVDSIACQIEYVMLIREDALDIYLSSNEIKDKRKAELIEEEEMVSMLSGRLFRIERMDRCSCFIGVPESISKYGTLRVENKYWDKVIAVKSLKFDKFQYSSNDNLYIK